MAPEGSRQGLRSLDAQIHAVVLDRRNGELRDPSQSGELALAQLLEFAQDAHGLSHRDLNSLLRRTKLLHFMASWKPGAFNVSGTQRRRGR